MFLETEPLFSLTRPPRPLARFVDPPQGQVEGYARHLAGQLAEHYKRHKPAKNQASLFGDGSRQTRLEWDEDLHPRESDGKFAEKDKSGETPAWLSKSKPVKLPAEKQLDLFEKQDRPLFEEKEEKPAAEPLTSDLRSLPSACCFLLSAFPRSSHRGGR